MRLFALVTPLLLLFHPSHPKTWSMIYIHVDHGHIYLKGEAGSLLL